MTLNGRCYLEAESKVYFNHKGHKEFSQSTQI